ncbi:MAG: SufS family cysteine desulfurase [Candidatus Micrarchaeota archaeon]
MTMDVDEIRADFPILSTTRNGKPIAYLDSAATSQKPRQVIDALSEFYSLRNANVGRSLYHLAEEATIAYAEARQKAAKFINAADENEIVFTSNTTNGVNTIFRGWGEGNIKKGERIVTTILEHHSNFVPWLQLARMKGAQLDIIDIDEKGKLREEDLGKLEGAKLFAFSAASNVAGTLTDVPKLCRLARKAGAVTIVDAAQYVPGNVTDVRKMGCDFLLFSGHKMLAPFGSGVLYGRKELLEEMEPFLYGSEMIREVHTYGATWNGLPHKFEAGTPNVAECVCLGVAMDYLNRVGLGNIRKHEEKLVSHMLRRMEEIEGLRIIGPGEAKERAGLVAFELEGVHPHDIAALLDEDGICVRSGHHCAMPLHEKLGIPASTRASVYLYNTEEEIDRLAESLVKIRDLFKGK